MRGSLKDNRKNHSTTWQFTLSRHLGFSLGKIRDTLEPLNYSHNIYKRFWGSMAFTFPPLGPFQFLRETEDNAHAKFWGDKQRALWYAIVFSAVVNNCCQGFEKSNFQIKAANN